MVKQTDKWSFIRVQKVICSTKNVCQSSPLLKSSDCRLPSAYNPLAPIVDFSSFHCGNFPLWMSTQVDNNHIAACTLPSGKKWFLLHMYTELLLELSVTLVWLHSHTGSQCRILYFKQWIHNGFGFCGINGDLHSNLWMHSLPQHLP